MELTKQDTQKAKGVAIIGMVMLHLFCRLGDLPYTPWVWIGETPLIYYLGLFGDFCVPIYCFCSGYAHYLLKEKHKTDYNKVTAQKLLRFLSQYWLVVILFSAVGLFTGNGAVIPGSLSEFFGNLLLYRLSYNGAWWFVITYIFLSVLSPVFFKITQKLNPVVLLLLSGFVYFVSYLFRFQFPITISNAVLNWIWQQLILLGTSQFSYMIGMVSRKAQWASKLRAICQGKPICSVCLLLALLAVFVGHCVVQSLIVAPITAMAVLLCLFGIRLPVIVDRLLLFMGKHSTNIWLVHMFFYFTLFENFVFVAKYPLFVLALMIAVCILTSVLINQISKGVQLWAMRVVKGNSE